MRKEAVTLKVKANINLFKLRAANGLTIHDLAEKAGVPEATISRAENGKALSVKSAGKLSKALDATFETLFFIERN